MFGLEKSKNSIFENWPKNSEGEYVKAAFLCHVPCIDLRDEILINLLDSCGIPCFKNYPGNGEFGKVVLGMSGDGADLFVPENYLEDAIAIISNESEESQHE